MTRPIRWGILGSGAVARGFAQGLRALPGAQLVAAASRTPATAQEFARSYNVPRVYTTYADLVRDPSVDVIYVATPHQRHLEDALLCIEHGKPVLCEKPFTVNARQACELVSAARRRQVFCMEGMWMRFIPAIRKVVELVCSGLVGEVRMITADFGVANQFDARGRHFDPRQAGGALLDLGVYPISLAFLLLGPPQQTLAQAHIGASGVDDQSAFVLGYPQGQLAVLSASLRTWSPQEAVIMGSKGRIRIHSPFYCPSKLTYTFAGEVAARAGGLPSKDRIVDRIKRNPMLYRLSRGGRNALQALLGRGSRTIKLPIEGNGYNYEAAEVMRCLRAGLLESPLMPLDETVRIMQTMDTMRAQWNLAYPDE